MPDTGRCGSAPTVFGRPFSPRAGWRSRAFRMRGTCVRFSSIGPPISAGCTGSSTRLPHTRNYSVEVYACQAWNLHGVSPPELLALRQPPQLRRRLVSLCSAGPLKPCSFGLSSTGHPRKPCLAFGPIAGRLQLFGEQLPRVLLNQHLERIRKIARLELSPGREQRPQLGEIDEPLIIVEHQPTLERPIGPCHQPRQGGALSAQCRHDVGQPTPGAALPGAPLVAAECTEAARVQIHPLPCPHVFLQEARVLGRADPFERPQDELSNRALLLLPTDLARFLAQPCNQALDSPIETLQRLHEVNQPRCGHVRVSRLRDQPIQEIALLDEHVSELLTRPQERWPVHSHPRDDSVDMPLARLRRAGSADKRRPCQLEVKASRSAICRRFRRPSRESGSRRCLGPTWA